MQKNQNFSSFPSYWANTWAGTDEEAWDSASYPLAKRGIKRRASPILGQKKGVPLYSDLC